MFTCLHSLLAPQSALLKLAQDFSPRFEIIGPGGEASPPLVMLDINGLGRLFGSAREIGEQLRRSAGGTPIRIAIAPSQTAAALLALGRAGLTVVSEAEQAATLAPLPVALLGVLQTLRTPADEKPELSTPLPAPVVPPNVAEMEDVLPYLESCIEKSVDVIQSAHRVTGARSDNVSLPAEAGSMLSAKAGGGGWSHPRDAHVAKKARRALGRRAPGTTHLAPGTRHPARWRAEAKDIEALIDVLRRWGVKTLGALAVLPAGEVYERLGARGVFWQRLARGEDKGPLVRWVPEDLFEGTLDLEWPIEGLEPLSFVLGRLLEPLADRLARADRGAAVLHTHLRLTTRAVHTRTLQLPAPMRDPKTLRTLLLLDLESNPPSAAIDRVRVLIEPTPARVLQWTLYERAQPSPEQVSTLIARLTALMGEGHVGSPRLVDSWKPGAFAMTPFKVPSAGCRVPGASHAPGSGHQAPGTGCATALRRFRLPVPARVQVQEGRPTRVMVDRCGLAGGAVEQAAGPWRTSGEWWNEGSYQPHRRDQPHQPHSWDRDEWDVALHDGTVYRLFVERDVGQWFIEGVVD